MEFVPPFHDINNFHHDQCMRVVGLLRFYLEAEKVPAIRSCYKQTIISIIGQHKKSLEEYASNTSMPYDTIVTNWLTSLKQQADNINEIV